MRGGRPLSAAIQRRRYASRASAQVPEPATTCLSRRSRGRLPGFSVMIANQQPSPPSLKAADAVSVDITAAIPRATRTSAPSTRMTSARVSMPLPMCPLGLAPDTDIAMPALWRAQAGFRGRRRWLAADPANGAGAARRRFSNLEAAGRAPRSAGKSGQGSPGHQALRMLVQGLGRVQHGHGQGRRVLPAVRTQHGTGQSRSSPCDIAAGRAAPWSDPRDGDAEPSNPSR